MKFLNTDLPVLHIEVGTGRLLIDAVVNKTTGVPALTFWWADQPAEKLGIACRFPEDTAFVPIACMTFAGDIEQFRANLSQLLGNLMQETYLFHERMDAAEASHE